MEIRRCPRCEEEKPVTQFYARGGGKPSAYCKTCTVRYMCKWAKAHPDKMRAAGRAWRAANREQARRSSRLTTWRNRGIEITNEEYEQLIVVQDGKCTICHKPITGRDIHLDHCHKTGQVRGLLCGGCNKGIGFFNDDQELLQKAIQYLQRFSAPRRSLQAR